MGVGVWSGVLVAVGSLGVVGVLDGWLVGVASLRAVGVWLGIGVRARVGGGIRVDDGDKVGWVVAVLVGGI